ncbi:MAG: hypothetical protein HY202_04070, partial [Nitrospirae bacterium]|nr:hypothetical protein [Nitrospirota bacterium]
MDKTFMVTRRNLERTKIKMRQTSENGLTRKCLSLIVQAGILLLAAGLGFPGKALAIQGFPGSTWDQVSHDVDRLVGTGAMGNINQGIDWVTLPGGITLNTFAEVRYRFRSENRPSFNEYGEAVGAEFKKSIFYLGADYVWERYPEIPDASNKVQFYLSGFYDWDLKPKSVAWAKGFPGSTWDQVSHDVDRLVGTGAMGNINQGIDWVTLPGGITL